jgi:hypothetical protein
MVYICLGVLALGGLITGLTLANNPPPTRARAAAPTPAPTGSGTHLITTFEHLGSQTSSSFTVPSAATAAHYMYQCPNGPANFSAKMQNTSGSDVQHIADTTGRSGSDVVALHPRHPGADYHLVVHTTCSFRVEVYSR